MEAPNLYNVGSNKCFVLVLLVSYFPSLIVFTSFPLCLHSADTSTILFFIFPIRGGHSRFSIHVVETFNRFLPPAWPLSSHPNILFGIPCLRFLETASPAPFCPYVHHSHFCSSSCLSCLLVIAAVHTLSPASQPSSMPYH